MNFSQDKQLFEIESLGIHYYLTQTEEGKQIQITEADFEKLFDVIRDLQGQVADLQNQLIENLKKEALIKNILNS
jgi:hypothetical protein